MGLLDGLFRKDPGRELDRAEGLLDDGRPYPALQIVQRVRDQGAFAERVAALERRCHEALGEAALAEADFMETEGDFAEAAEWVRSAIRQLGEKHERVPELRSRLKTLRKRAEEAKRSAAMSSLLWYREQAPPTGPDPLTTEMRFGALVGTLRDEVADLYLSRPLAFQQAHVDLNEGRLDAARAAYDQMIVAEPDDAILRLERGRCRLIAGDPIGAREDLEAAWPALGDEPLDQEEWLSVPLLWAEACMAMDDPEAVIQGLTDLAGFAEGTEPVNAETARIFGRALLAADRAEDAVEYLRGAVEIFGVQAAVTRVLADALVRTGEPDRAIELLEGKIGPSCSTGSCSAPPLDPQATATLVRLYLDRTPEGETPPDRVGGLLAHSARQRGGSTLDELELLARYQRMCGLDEEAERTEAEIERHEEAE
jgi:predicted Zn-dependent protease